MEKVNLGKFGYPNYDVYENGCIWSHNSKKFLSPQKGFNNYLRVMLSSYGIGETLRILAFRDSGIGIGDILKETSLTRDRVKSVMRETCYKKVIKKYYDRKILEENTNER